MTFVKFGPAKDFEEINNKIHSFVNDLPNVKFNIDFSFKPKADIYVDDENLFVEMEVPGVPKDALKISLKNNILTISGEKQNSNAGNEKNNYYKNERSFGEFSREFNLPVEINPDKVNASFENGVLKISIAKAEKVDSKKDIKIN